MENQSVESDDIVSLVLGENRLEASREKLARYSLYFASLFSENFKDHSQSEFAINYDISLTTLKNFIHWINNEGELTRVIHSPKYLFVVRASLEKFLTGHHIELLELLEVSIVFMTEKLTDNIIEIIIRTRLTPPKVLDMWLLGENLGLKVLRDVALSVCLDRFDELPEASLMELPIDNFYKLLLNVNVKSTPSRLLTVRDLWKKHNDVPADLPESFALFLNSDPTDLEQILKKNKKHQVICVSGNKPKKSLGFYTWNGNTLREVAEMTNELIHTTFNDNGQDMTGWQIIGRDSSIYLIGGEQGMGTGRFNMALWRYCLISKKWYTETLLPQARRHMAVAFLGNKLYLFGGVGRHRIKLSSVDVFDVYTGLWSEAAEIPEDFTEVPASYVLNGKFIYHVSYYYVYDPKFDAWSKYETDIFSDFPVHSIIGQSDDRYMFVLSRSEDNKWKLHRYFINWQKQFFVNGNEYNLEIYKPRQSFGYLEIICWPNHVTFSHAKDSATGEVEFISRDLRQFDRQPQHGKLKISREELKNVLPNSFNHQLNSFNLIDPEHLHTLKILPKKECINV